MTRSEMRYAILRTIELQQKTGQAGCVDDAIIASAIGIDLSSVQQQLKRLHAEQLVELRQPTHTTYAAALTYHRPQLRLIGGRLRCFHRFAHPIPDATARSPEENPMLSSDETIKLRLKVLLDFLKS